MESETKRETLVLRGSLSLAPQHEGLTGPHPEERSVGARLERARASGCAGLPAHDGFESEVAPP